MPATYALEYTVLPLIGLPYFLIAQEFSLPAALANNGILTAACGGAAYYYSCLVAKRIGKRHYKGRLEPVWPGFMSLVLAYLAILQIIIAITHISYYRDGPLVHDIFDA